MKINKHLIRLRIAIYNISAAILTSIILFLSKIEWRIIFTTYCLPLIHIPLSKVFQPLTLSFNYLKAIMTAHDLISSGIITLNKIITLTINSIQSILNTFIMLGIFSVIIMTPITLPILMVCTSSLGILLNFYSLIENIVIYHRNIDPAQNEKLKMTMINAAVNFSMSVIVSAAIGTLLFFTGIGSALLLGIGIAATITLIAGTISTSLLGYKISTMETNTKPDSTNLLLKSMEKTISQENTNDKTKTNPKPASDYANTDYSPRYWGQTLSYDIKNDQKGVKSILTA